MGSKAIVFLGLLVVMLLLVSSEVAARDLVEETSKATEAEPDQYHGGHGGGHGHGGGYGHCHHGCCGHGHYGCRCCNYAGQAVDADFNEAETHN